MEALLAERGRSDITVDRQACLWSCTRPLQRLLAGQPALQLSGRRLRAGPGAAEAILAWFDLHGESETGEVPFRTWPQAMRGHFIARFPPVKT